MTGSLVKWDGKWIQWSYKHEQLKYVFENTYYYDEKYIGEQKVEDCIYFANYIGVLLEDWLDSVKVLQGDGRKIFWQGANIGVETSNKGEKSN